MNEWQEDVFPPSPRGEALRQTRIDCEIGLRAAARALRLSAADLSALEAGRAEFADPIEWWSSEKALRAVAGEQQ